MAALTPPQSRVRMAIFLMRRIISKIGFPYCCVIK